MSFAEFLSYLTGPGIATIVAFIATFLADRWPWFNDLQARDKVLLFLVLSMIIPIGGAFLQVLYGFMPFSFEETFWPAIQAGFVASGIGTIVHRVKPKEE